MAVVRHLILIAYDVSDNKDRGRVADLLERHMTRVQGSVFEGWMTVRAGQRLEADAAALIDASDSLRYYVMPRGGIDRCQAWGFPPAPIADGILII